jgi:hypothetical protein
MKAALAARAASFFRSDLFQRLDACQFIDTHRVRTKLSQQFGRVGLLFGFVTFTVFFISVSLLIGQSRSQSKVAPDTSQTPIFRKFADAV